MEPSLDVVQSFHFVADQPKFLVLITGRSHVSPATCGGRFERSLGTTWLEATNIWLPWWGRVGTYVGHEFLTVRGGLGNSSATKMRLNWLRLQRIAKPFSFNKRNGLLRDLLFISGLISLIWKLNPRKLIYSKERSYLLIIKGWQMYPTLRQ